MPYEYNEYLTSNSRELRKNMTPEENHLWYDFLARLPITVNRQKIIDNYIVDFYIHSRKIVIELDGIQHKTEEHKAKDDERDAYLAELGISVLRYDNETIRKSFVFVCEDILEHLELDFSSLKPKRIKRNR